jgi:hypothetical protein
MATNQELNTIIGDLQARTGNNRTLDDALVDEASAAEHPLHGEFDWDDVVAGPKWRREQAKRLIKLARIEVADTTKTDRSVRVPAFVRNPVEPPGSYIPMVRLREDADVALEVVRREFERVYRALERAEKVAAAIPGMAMQVAVERARIGALMRRFAT